MSVYLLHFERPISPQHTTQHYLGFADGELDAVLRRTALHAKGQSQCRLTEVAHERGIAFDVVRVFAGDSADRKFERRLKNRKNAPKLCPICSAHAADVHCADVVSLTGDALRDAIATQLCDELFAVAFADVEVER